MLHANALNHALGFSLLLPVQSAVSSYAVPLPEQLETILNRTFKEIEDISDVHQMTNAQLKRIIQKIEVDKDGNVDIYLRIFGDLGLDETVLISDNQTFRHL